MVSETVIIVSCIIFLFLLFFLLPKLLYLGTMVYYALREKPKPASKTPRYSLAQVRIVRSEKRP